MTEPGPTTLLLAPAAYHRQVEPEAVSRRFVLRSTRFQSWSIVPLALAVCAEFYLVASVATHRRYLSLALTVALPVVFVALWFVLPRRAAPSGP